MSRFKELVENYQEERGSHLETEVWVHDNGLTTSIICDGIIASKHAGEQGDSLSGGIVIKFSHMYDKELPGASESTISDGIIGLWKHQENEIAKSVGANIHRQQHVSQCKNEGAKNHINPYTFWTFLNKKNRQTPQCTIFAQRVV